MKIKDINWIDKEAKEASVVVSDGTYDVVCFAHPLDLDKGQSVDMLNCLDVDDIFLSEEKYPEIIKLDNNYKYFIRGILNGNILTIGGIHIDLSGCYIPADIKDNDFIELKVLRIDIY